MVKTLTFDIQKYIAVAVMGIVLSFGMFLATPTAHAESSETFSDGTGLQEQINQLLELINSLQAQLNGSISPNHGVSGSIGPGVGTSPVRPIPCVIADSNGRDGGCIQPVEAFGIDDIKSVTKREGGNDQLDSGYTEYKIFLKHGSVVKVKSHHFAPRDAFENNLHGAGYTGEVAAFLKFVEKDGVVRNYTVAEIKAITVTKLHGKKKVVVTVDLDDSEERSIKMKFHYQGKNKAVKKIANKLDGKYHFDFSEFPSKKLRNKAVRKLIHWDVSGSRSCKSGDKWYKEGTEKQSITVDGSTSSIDDAHYVCKKGKWEIEGSLPSPSGPSGLPLLAPSEVLGVSISVDPLMQLGNALTELDATLQRMLK